MVSSIGLRWGFDTGTQMAVEHFTGRQNLHKEGNNLVCELIFCTIIDLQIGIREQNAIKLQNDDRYFNAIAAVGTMP